MFSLNQSTSQAIDSMNHPSKIRRFAVAVSFPSEHRRFVRNVVKRLAEKLGPDRIFYDEWYEAELIGVDGDLKLRKYYREQSEIVVPFFSEHYKKPWCEIEWHAIRAMLMERRDENAVVPVQMDVTRVEGWESIDFAIRRKGRTGAKIADLILKAYRHRHPERYSTTSKVPQIMPSDGRVGFRDIPVGQNVNEIVPGAQELSEHNGASVYPTDENPYRFLDYYDVQDKGALHGRDHVSQSTLAEVRSRANPGGKPMIVQITGESGCGKSSFMRAGLLAGLAQSTKLGRFKVLAVLPSDFHDEHGRPDRNPPARLLSIISRNIAGVTLHAADKDRVARAGPRAAEQAVAYLTRSLSKMEGEIFSLVIGLDQFEEIVDDLDQIQLRPFAAAWRKLLEFVDLATATGRLGFVYTLELSRQEAFARIDIPEVFRQAHVVRLGGVADSFLETIITKPFERAGYRLSPHVVDALIASYKDYSSRTHGHASPLPLLSLKLSNLFETVRSLRKDVQPRSHRHTELNQQFQDSNIEISLDEIGDELRIDNEIKDLVHSVWRVNSSRSEEEQLDDLNPFLQPLVTLSGDDFDTINLQTVGDSLFVNMDQRLSEFEDVRLVIRENGRRRLVHEAVIRQWPLASKWLEHKRRYLAEEAVFRSAANRWSKMRTEDQLPSDDRSIEVAGAILRSYIQEWIYTRDEDLTLADRVLKEFCQGIFRKSDKPRKTSAEFFRKSYAHIHLAAGYGMLDLVGRFLSLDPTCIELRSQIGRTPIHHAAWSDYETTRLLLGREANPVVFDEDGWSPISAAIWSNDEKIFHLLLPHYTSAESIRAPSGTTLLHVAARRGSVRMAISLMALVEGADPNAEDDYGRTCLDFAAINDQVEAFNYFRQYCDVTRRDQNDWTVLHHAAFHGALKVTDEILSLPEFHDSVEASTTAGLTALMIAAMQRRDVVVRRLASVMGPNTQVEASSRYMGWTALHFAIFGPEGREVGGKKGRLARFQALRTVRALLETTNIDPNREADNGVKPIDLSDSLPQVRRELISHLRFASNTKLNDGSPVLNHLITNKDRSAVERMLQRTDLDVNSIDSDGSYCLALLIANDMSDLAAHLLDEGRVQPWRVAGVKSPGLLEAIYLGKDTLSSAILDLLPDEVSGANIRLLTVAAGIAIALRREGILQRILALGADPKLRLNDTGWTLFHYAAMVGDRITFDLLAGKSDATSLRDAWGRRPSDLAPDATHEHFAARMQETDDEPYVPPPKANELFAAARRGDVEMFKTFFDHPEVNLLVRDDWGRSPADHAPDAVREELTSLLRSVPMHRET